MFTHCGRRRAPTQTPTIQPFSASPGQWKLTTQNTDNSPNSHHLHLQTSPRLPTARPRGQNRTLAVHTQAWDFPAGLNFYSDLRARMLLDVRQGGGRPVSSSALRPPVPGTCWMENSFQTLPAIFFFFWNKRAEINWYILEFGFSLTWCCQIKMFYVKS